MKSFYIEDWMLENGVNPVLVLLLILLGITVPLLIVLIRQWKKHHSDNRKDD